MNIDGGEVPYRETFRLGMEGVDAFGIIYYTKYWEWFGLGVEGILEAAGHPLRDVLDTGMGFPVAHAEIDYHAPVRLGDRIDMSVFLDAIGHRSLRFRAEFRHQGNLVASASTVQVAVSKAGEPAEVPRGLRDYVDSYRSSAVRARAETSEP